MPTASTPLLSADDLSKIRERARRFAAGDHGGDETALVAQLARDAASLLADPNSALATHDIPGLVAIELRAVTVRFPRSRVTYESSDADLRRTERAAEMRDALSTGAIEWAKLYVTVEGRKRPTSIELSSSRKKYLRTAPEVERVLHELLLARGMMLLPARPVPTAFLRSDERLEQVGS